MSSTTTRRPDDAQPDDEQPRNAIIYTRVSDERGRDEGIQSHDVQTEKCEAWCKHKDWPVVATLHERSTSGKKMDRPVFNQAMAMLVAGEADAIVVYRLTRLGRGFLDTLDAARKITELGAVIVSTQEGLDLSTYIGRLMFRIMLSIAEYELELITDNWATYRERTIREGIPMPIPKFGYERQMGEVDGKLKQVGPLLVNEAHRELITGAFERRATGMSWVAIKDWLRSEHGVTTSVPTLQGMLSNRVYLGEVRHGEFFKEGAHDALVDPLTFKRAQRNGVKFRGDGKPRLLSGIARCAGCRSTMAHVRPSGREPYYTCRNASLRREVCTGPASIDAQRLEDYIDELLLDKLSERKRRARDDGGKGQFRLVNAEIARTDNELDEWTTPANKRKVGNDRFYAGIDDLETELAEWKSKLDALEEEFGPQPGEEEVEEDADYLKLPLDQKRRFLGAHIPMVFVRPTTARGKRNNSRDVIVERTKLIWHPHTVDVPRPPHKFDWRPFTWTDEPEAAAGTALGEQL